MFNVGEGRYHTMVFTIGPGEVSQGGGDGEGGRGGKCWIGGKRAVGAGLDDPLNPLIIIRGEGRHDG